VRYRYAHFKQCEENSLPRDQKNLDFNVEHHYIKDFFLSYNQSQQILELSLPLRLINNPYEFACTY
jgi:hypothetical protein